MPIANVYILAYFKDNGQDGLHLAFSRDGYKWKPLKGDSSFLKPTIGPDKLMRDPCIVRGPDKIFHLVFTTSWDGRVIGHATSPDLINWSKQQAIKVMENEPNTQNAWAPELTWNNKTNNWLVYWSSSIAGKFLAKDTVGEDKYDHRIYYTETRNFKSFTKSKLFYNPGFNCIDANIIPWGRRYLMFLKDETKKPLPHKYIRMATSDKITGGYGNLSDPISGRDWAEGPASVEIDGKLVVYFDKYTLGKWGAVSSSDLKTWTDISQKISIPPGARHGSIFSISRQEFDKLGKLF